MESSQALFYGCSGVAVGVAFLAMLGWLQRKTRVQFVGSGAILPWLLILYGLYNLARGLLGV